MPNEENMAEPEVQGQEASQEVAAPPEPKDLSEAFKVLRANEQAAAAPSVEPGQPDPEPIQEEQPQESYQDIQYDGGADAGGSAAELQSSDYGAYAQGLITESLSQARQLVTQEFRNNKVEKWNTGKLYQKDENTGEVSFFNPESPSQPFKTRAEAQAWCESINADIDSEYRRMVNEKQRELMDGLAPALRLLEFAPKFDQMSQLEQDIFDDIVEGYEVYNAAGDVIGYNIDLNAAAARAKNFASKYGAQQQQAVPQQKSSGPAVDMKSSSSSAQGKEDLKEPTNLEEAMRMLKKKG